MKLGHPRTATILAALIATSALGTTAAAAQVPTSGPGSAPYMVRDTQNIVDAYGRQHGPNGQLTNPNYHSALVLETADNGVDQLIDQAAAPNRLAITPGNVFPGWNAGNPLRRGWTGTRGQRIPVTYTNRYGALIRGNVFAPLPGARDPYTGAELQAPYPGVVITTGSVQGSEHMYWWLAQDLAERGYVVLTYDVQGQGTSETLPHQGDQVDALPFCNPFAPPGELEMFGCPGVPAQQDSNFVYGTQDALSFFLSTPDDPYANPASSDVQVNDHNPLWKLFDRSPDKKTATPGRTTRVAIVGHSLGASAVSHVQGVDERVQAVVALDKLAGGDSTFGGSDVTPVVPALAIQSEYGFTVAALLEQQRLLPDAAARVARRRARPAPRAEDGLRRLARRRGRLDARRAARLDPPRVHRHPVRPAREPPGPGALEHLRAGLARPLPEAPQRPAPARDLVALPRAGGDRRLGGGRARPREPAQFLLLLGLVDPRRQADPGEPGPRRNRRLLKGRLPVLMPISGAAGTTWSTISMMEATRMSQYLKPVDQARATLETAIEFGLDEKDILDAVVSVWQRTGVDPDALEDLSATLADRILLHERSR